MHVCRPHDELGDDDCPLGPHRSLVAPNGPLRELVEPASHVGLGGSPEIQSPPRGRRLEKRRRPTKTRTSELARDRRSFLTLMESFTRLIPTCSYVIRALVPESPPSLARTSFALSLFLPRPPARPPARPSPRTNDERPDRRPQTEHSPTINERINDQRTK